MVERRQFPRRFDADSDARASNGDAPAEATPAALDSALGRPLDEHSATPEDAPDNAPEAADTAMREDGAVDDAEGAVDDGPVEDDDGGGELPAGLARAVRDAETPTAEVARRPGDPPPPPDAEELPRRLEAVLFVADQPVDESTLALALSIDRPELQRGLEALGEVLRQGARGIRLQRGPDGVQLVSDPAASDHVEYFLGLEASRRLSNAALETLAIVAYRQPITRGGIDAIRGVNSDGAVATLRSRGLIQETGRASTPGRPRLFGTTQRFLEHFGLETASQLPPLPEDIDLPAHEIGEQLGLDETEVAALLAAEAAAEAVPPDEDAEISGEVTELAGAAAALAGDAERPDATSSEAP